MLMLSTGRGPRDDTRAPSLTSRARRGAALAALALAALARPVVADPLEDFAAAVRDYSGPVPALVLTKLTKFQLGPRCAAKLADKNQGALHAASFATRDLTALAKAWTGEDWSAVFSNASSPEEGLRLVEPMIDALGARLQLTVIVDGPDCDASANSLWLKAWGQVATTLAQTPPPGGRSMITIKASSKVRKASLAMSKDAATVTIEIPKDIEDPTWIEVIDRPFRQLFARIPDDFAFGLKEHTGRFSTAAALGRLHTFQVGPACRAKLPRKDGGALHAASFAIRDIVAYAKSVTGDDWDAIESQTANDRETNRKLAEDMIESFRGQFGFKIVVEGADCDGTASALWLRYWTTIATAIRDHVPRPPKGKRLDVTLTVSSKARDVKVTVGGGGASYAFVAPRDIEPAGWTDKLTAPFARARQPSKKGGRR